MIDGIYQPGPSIFTRRTLLVCDRLHMNMLRFTVSFFLQILQKARGYMMIVFRILAISYCDQVNLKILTDCNYRLVIQHSHGSHGPFIDSHWAQPPRGVVGEVTSLRTEP